VLVARKEFLDHDRFERDALTLLRGGPCASLAEEAVKRFVAGGKPFDVLAGVAIYNEADEARLALLIKGLVRVYMNTGDGRQVTVRYVRRGGLLGAPALVGGAAPVFVQALVDSTLYFLDAPHVMRLARHEASVAWCLAEECVHRLYDVLEELAGNTFATVRQRVIRHLLDLAASRPGSDARLTALVNQQDLANSVGSVREVVARVLHELRAESLVRTAPGRIEIVDPEKMSLELWTRGRDQSHSKRQTLPAE
jgi:CRP/FNR family transcriptional regulator, cyclic AMP receptor protein